MNKALLVGCAGLTFSLTLMAAGCGVAAQRPPADDSASPPADAAASATSVPAPVAPLASPPVEAVVSSPLAVTLGQAAVLTFQRDVGLQVQAINPDLAATAVSVQRAAFDLQLQASANRYQTKDSTPQTTISTPAGPIPVSGLASSSTIDTYDAQLNELLPTGTQISIGIGTQRQTINPDPRFYNTRPFVTITQSLLQGANVSANLAALRMAKISLTISRYEFRGYAQDLLAQMENAYWDMELAQRQIEIVDAALQGAKTQGDDVDERIAVGKLADSERAAARAEIASREQDRIDAVSASEKARLNFLRLVGPTDEAWWSRQVVTETLAEQLPDDPDVSLDEHLLLAMVLRPDLNEARLEVQNGTLQVVQTRNGLLPRLDFFITMGSTGYSNDLGPSFHAADGNNYDLSFGLNFTMDLVDRAERANFANAQLTTVQAALAVHQAEQLAQLEVRTAVVEVQRAHAQIQASAATAQLRQETLDNEKAKLSVGRGTAFAVAQADRDLLSSRLDAVRSVISYRKALISLYQAEGSLLQRRGISVSGAAPAEDPAALLQRCAQQGLSISSSPSALAPSIAP